MTASTANVVGLAGIARHLEVRYERAANPPKATGCQSGVRALGLAVGHSYPELLSMKGGFGCYNRRYIKGTTTWSLHSEGRALDIGVPPQWRDLAWRLACAFTSDRIVYGTMRVIWDGHIWTTEERDRWRPLLPTTPQHHDHIHFEAFWASATRPGTIQSEMESALARSRT